METRAIKKLLVANRGEIALRVIRSARMLGIRTAAVYSEADASMAHVAAADEAWPIGPAEAARSYLNITAIIEAARASGADAIHPGYGFLSERPEFARAVAREGLVFVGPRADVMEKVGDKIAARQLAREAGVPAVPGIDAGDLASARRFAQQSGFPILVKAAAGGGGRGMRVVESEGELESALEAASREALAAFGDGRIFLERYLARPRHIEVQLLGDNHGGLVALGERDCSIQRRHQKLIEESPAPGISEQMRERIIGAALRLAEAAGYTNAGTAEFLVDGEQFFFLEVNARLQVEHPITELRFGCDLVAEQLKVAAGERVSTPAQPRGAAIECRINAEDAEHDFRPATGRVLQLRLPSGPGVRVDTYLAPGTEISPFYDSLVAKLISYGADREQARRRMLAAFEEWSLLGVNSTAGFLRDIIASDAFARADLSTRFLPEFFPGWRPAREINLALLAAAMIADGSLDSGDGASNSGAAHQRRRLSSPWETLGAFELWTREARW